MYTIIATPLRKNSAYNQIQRGNWNFDDDFQSLAVSAKSFEKWDAQLAMGGRLIALRSVGEEVWVDEVKLTFSQMLNLRGYIRETYFPRVIRDISFYGNTLCGITKG